jgi:hypothetical protein
MHDKGRIDSSESEYLNPGMVCPDLQMHGFFSAKLPEAWKTTIHIYLLGQILGMFR